MHNIKILDGNEKEFNCEDRAMLSALFSRSKNNVDNHINRVIEKGSSEFINKYYIGYDHESIGQLSSITIFIHDVSILAAKAIEQHVFSSYQETSTRFVNFEKHSLYELKNKTENVTNIENKLLSMYKYYTEELKALYKKENPELSDSALNVKTLDITSSLLPCSSTTNVSWHGSISAIREHLSELINHPLQEVKDIGFDLHNILKTKYPNSFNKLIEPNIDIYYDDIDNEFTDLYLDHTNMDYYNLFRNEEKIVLNTTRKKLPRRLDKYGYYKIIAMLDYATYRDLQRHRRNLYLSMPLITNDYGFCEYYSTELEKINPLFKQEIKKLFKDIINIFELDYLNRQYIYPLGTNVVFEWVCTLPQLIYVMELRTKPNSRQTIRELMYKIHSKFKETTNSIYVNIDYKFTDFEKRSTQIVKII